MTNRVAIDLLPTIQSYLHELQNAPDQRFFPWMNWLCQDQDGEWYWFEYKPLVFSWGLVQHWMNAKAESKYLYAHGLRSRQNKPTDFTRMLFKREENTMIVYEEN